MAYEAKTPKVTEDIVQYVANLSRLSFAASEVPKFQEQLSNILGYVDQLNEVDTENTQPTSHALSSMKNVFREDTPYKSLPLEEVLKNAPAREGKFFKVPKIIKEA
ncbi:MAG: Asp-tRNA(Asn)/Glu-tRNA(Gln) amidotransferase subunit GatC [Candidatus Omnitrophica bacterium]|nr:Asp-tRNA(Asn)/Glu-tRNA(Gln) amidotransferase subunit GatC [Candidatus Omnitrophota bacterium]